MLPLYNKDTMNNFHLPETRKLPDLFCLSGIAPPQCNVLRRGPKSICDLDSVDCRNDETVPSREIAQVGESSWASERRQASSRLWALRFASQWHLLQQHQDDSTHISGILTGTACSIPHPWTYHPVSRWREPHIPISKKQKIEVIGYRQSGVIQMNWSEKSKVNWSVSYRFLPLSVSPTYSFPIHSLQI